MFYGVTRKNQLLEIVHDVCHVFRLPHHNEKDIQNAIAQCVETLCVETRLGTARDVTLKNVGVGVCQFDQIGFTDTVARMKPAHKQKAFDVFGVDFNGFTLNDLAYAPAASIILMRNFYLLLPDKLSPNRLARAKLWKQRYNTVAGAGTIEHYLAACEVCL